MKKIDNTDFFSQAHEFLLEGKSIRINIRGNSMKPFLREGSHQAEIAPAEGRNLKTGDVVLFRHCSRYVLHRIVAINDERYTMQGDGVLENTETVLGHSVYYFWELQKTNNYELIRKLRLPTYIVQGKKDPLVPENEGWRQYNNKIGEGVKYVTYRSFPGLNHVLMSDSSTDAYGLPQYTENATLDISAGRSIGQWILSLKSTAE